jgi:phosphatidate cytidylyltransferase
MRMIKSNELIKRFIIAFLGIPLILSVSWIGGIVFLIFIDAILTIALLEFYELIKKKGFFPSKVLGIFSALCISWNIYFFKCHGLYMIFILCFICIQVNELFHKRANPLINSAVTIFGILYISLFSFFLLIREGYYSKILSDHVGGSIVILVFITIWISDTSAYFSGKFLGKHLLYKCISPNKTWEGSVVGFLSGVAAAIGLRYLLVDSISFLDSLVIGTIIGIIGQISDLIESMYKRDVGVKDTSNILPGHGGLLDRFDSALLVGPIVYCYLLLF